MICHLRHTRLSLRHSREGRYPSGSVIRVVRHCGQGQRPLTRGGPTGRSIRLFSLALLFCLGFTANAQEDTFRRANEAYQQGRPEEAVSLYKSMQASGVEDAALYFNLGNAYAAQGMTGETVLSYLRALRLAPGDDDIRANLLMARRHAAETAEPPRVGPLPQLKEEQWGGASTPAQIAQTAFYLYAAAIVMLAAVLLARRRQRATLARALIALSAALFVAAAVFTVFSWQRVNAFQQEERAVVLAPNTSVRRGPIETAESLFSLPAGEIVSLEERREQWGLIRLPERPEGWVLLSQVEPVIP